MQFHPGGVVFFSSEIILWVTIYFIIAYIKHYLKYIAESININLCLLFFGIIGNTGLIFLTDVLGLKFSFLAKGLLRWNGSCNPFLILTAIALMNIARHGHFKNKVINNISKLSLLIYIIHENILIRYYYRPYIWQFIYENFGYAFVILWVFAVSFAVFAAAAAVSYLYKQTLQRIVKIASEKIYVCIKALYGKYETLMFKLH